MARDHDGKDAEDPGDGQDEQAGHEVVDIGDAARVWMAPLDTEVHSSTNSTGYTSAMPSRLGLRR
jgi:hypothetical protein